MSKYIKILKKKRFYIFSFSLFSFLIIAFLVLKYDYLGIDEYGYNLISEYLISDKVTPFIKIITNLGGGLFLIIFCFISYFVIKKRPIFYGLIANLSISVCSNLIIKEILKRDRPIAHRIINETGYSFPSGHAMVSMAFYGFLIYLIYVYWDNKKYKWSLIIFLSFLILIIGISRIYLGVHYLSDVLGGFLLSLAYLIGFVYLFNLYLKKHNKTS